MKNLMNHLPYKIAYYDAQGHALFDNGGADGSFLRDDVKQDLPSWIREELLLSDSKSLQMQIPTDAFDKILFAHYQASLDDQGQLLGFSETVYDFRQALTSYLNETGQAIVGWSDVTSGPSIKNDLYDDLEN
ncbi:sodium transporter [Streptococcus loxodontisalivarius]|uniref:Sodium transporter n=1 Tax=Streptococcus loxodontisalivarius TaxID=1349415 RepID=A0ABS2PRX4_9STRE|nr:sodium transporter [Streptococcus loxodontisalivarius]MBM7642777.1 hypothetical protein [Streptococcus loxodontisalivarius]